MTSVKHRRSVPLVEQMQQTECGLCCVAMILKYYKNDESITTIRKTLDAGRDGLKLSVLGNYLREKGFETKIYKTNSNVLKELKLPAIIFWNKEHFVVLEKIHYNNSFTIVDPAFGRRKVDKETFEECFSNVVMTIEPSDKFVPVREKRHVWKDVITNIISKKRLLTIIVLLTLITYGLELGLPIIIQNMMDSIMGNAATSQTQYFWIALGTMGILGIINFLRAKKVLQLQLDVDSYLSTGTFSKLLRLPYKYFDGRAAGDIIFRLNSLSTIRDLLSEQIVQTIIRAGMLIFIVGYMMMKSVTITLIAIAVFALLGVYIFAMKPWITEANYNEMMENTKLQTAQVETIYSIFAIKVSAMEETVEKKWLDAYNRCIKAFEKKSKVLNIYSLVVTVIQLLVPVILMAIGISFSMEGKMTIGETIALYSLTGSFFSTGLAIYNSYNDFLGASAYMERIRDILETEDEKEPENEIEIDILGDVDIKNLSFSYTNHSERVLEDINLHIEKGEKVAIVGGSGSGKSTLAKVILGLYEPSEGDVMYDGVSIKNMNRRKIRKQIGIVPQDMSLFNKSIYENIRMNQEKYGIEDVKNAAKIAQIDEEIESMPMKYHTMVSDMGMNLSGGQRQRIALARALINEHNLIVLDEATSALDYENERKVSDYFAITKCTRIIIAHRLSTIIDADKIIVLHKGKICEVGTHEELISSRGVYAMLYNSELQMAS